MTLFTVRTARRTDVDGVLALWRTSAQNASRPADSPGAVLTLIARDPAAPLVAEDHDEVIGSVSVR